MALTSEGRVVCWGDNDYGQTTVPADVTGVVAIAAGGIHSVALTGAGRVICWGNGSFGQLAMPADMTGVVAIAAGALHSVALTREGRVVCWGDGSYDATTVPMDATGVVAIAAGDSYSMVLKSRPLNPLSVDTDGDGMWDGWGDTDGDGMTDGWELMHSLNPFVNDADEDPDGDGYSNLAEFLAGSDPQSAASVPLEAITLFSLFTPLEP